MKKKEKRKRIQKVTEDLVSMLLWYERKECPEYVPVGMIEKAVNKGTVTTDEIVGWFQDALEEDIEAGRLELRKR